MKKTNVLISLFALASAVVLYQSCATAKITDRGAAQLWSENCLRCHYSPSPNSFTDDGWDVVSMHMRVRGNLTEEESEIILDFLKSGN